MPSKKRETSKSVKKNILVKPLLDLMDARMDLLDKQAKARNRQELGLKTMLDALNQTMDRGGYAIEEIAGVCDLLREAIMEIDPDVFNEAGNEE